MIINIDITLESIDNLGDVEVGRLIHEIVESSIRGSHLIIMRRQVCRHLTLRTDSQFQIAVLQRIKDQYTQYAGMIDQKVPYIRISDEDLFEASPYHVELSTVLEAGIYPPSILLVENSSVDGGFYREALMHFARLLRVPNLTINVVNGGGGDICNVLDSTIDPRKIIVVVVDSDKQTPFQPIEGGFAEINKKLKKLPSGLHVCYATPCHEIENFLTLNEIEHLSQWNEVDEKTNYINMYRARKKRNCDLSRYLDLKSGRIKFDPKGKSKREIGWVELKNKEFNLSNNEPLGERLIASFLGSDPAKSSFHTTMRSDRWLRDFRIFFESVVCWFISDRPFRIT